MVFSFYALWPYFYLWYFVWPFSGRLYGLQIKSAEATLQVTCDTSKCSIVHVYFNAKRSLLKLSLELKKMTFYRSCKFYQKQSWRFIGQCQVGFSGTANLHAAQVLHHLVVLPSTYLLSRLHSMSIITGFERTCSENEFSVVFTRAKWQYVCVGAMNEDLIEFHPFQPLNNTLGQNAQYIWTLYSNKSSYNLRLDILYFSDFVTPCKLICGKF